MNVFDIYEMTPIALIEYLMRKGWTQEQIAHEVDATQPTICRIWKGKHKQPRHGIVDRLRNRVMGLEELA